MRCYNCARPASAKATSTAGLSVYACHTCSQPWWAANTAEKGWIDAWIKEANAPRPN